MILRCCKCNAGIRSDALQVLGSFTPNSHRLVWEAWVSFDIFHLLRHAVYVCVCSSNMCESMQGFIYYMAWLAVSFWTVNVTLALIQRGGGGRLGDDHNDDDADDTTVVLSYCQFWKPYDMNAKPRPQGYSPDMHDSTPRVYIAIQPHGIQLYQVTLTL
eukprot:5297923-Amphidinium_carterae.1